MTEFLEDTRDLLQRTPAVLRALLTGLPETWMATPDVAGGWRPRDVVGHLISAELDVWIPRTRRTDNLAKIDVLATDAEVGPWKAYLGILLRRDDPAAVPG